MRRGSYRTIIAHCGPATRSNSRLASFIAIFPVIGHPSIAEDEFDEIGESCLGTNVVRQDDNAALISFNANQSIRSLPVVAPFEETVTLRPVEDYNAEACE